MFFLLLSNFGENCSFSLLFLQEWHLVSSSAAVARLVQESMCCAFRDALLHSLLVTSGYLSRLIFLLRCQQDIFSL